jgi:hypothetical protein
MQIIGISGRKQSGKNTVANYINGYVLQNKQMIESFFIEDNGNLAIKTKDNAGSSAYGIFDVTRQDESFIHYAEKELWPYIKVYHFADPLKEMCVELFDLNPQYIYGDNDDKNRLTSFFWKDMPGITNQHADFDKQMSHRDFLEYFGTGVIRLIKFDAWSSFTIKRILAEGSEIAIVPDVRFPNEVEAIKSAGGIVIRLTRDLFNSNAMAECALDENVYDWSNFDIIIDNKNITLEQLCDKLQTLNSNWS